jgi:hypothetical protein
MKTAIVIPARYASSRLPGNRSSGRPASTSCNTSTNAPASQSALPAALSQTSRARRIERPRDGTEEILGRISARDVQPATWAAGRRPDPVKLFGPALVREANDERLRCRGACRSSRVRQAVLSNGRKSRSRGRNVA